MVFMAVHQLTIKYILISFKLNSGNCDNFYKSFIAGGFAVD